MHSRVYISDIRNLHDARYCAAAGVSLISFRMTAMASEEAAGIRGWLSGVEIAGEFGGEEEQEILAWANASGLDYLSLPADRMDFCRAHPERKYIIRISDPLPAAEIPPQHLFAIRANRLAELSTEQAERAICLLETEADDSLTGQIIRLKPFAVAPGLFIRETDGCIDYVKCDAFLERTGLFIQ